MIPASGLDPALSILFLETKIVQPGLLTRACSSIESGSEALRMEFDELMRAFISPLHYLVTSLGL